MTRFQLVTLAIDPAGVTRRWAVIRNATSLDALWKWIRRRREGKKPLPRRLVIQQSGREPVRAAGHNGRRFLRGQTAHV